MNNILTQKQKDFLNIFGKDKILSKDFYLSGGTALAGFYLPYRYSEDLDFFSEREFDVSDINVFLTDIKNKLGITKIDFQQSYNRNLFFCHLSDHILKLEFTYFPFPRIEKGIEEEGVQIDSLFDIAVNKLFTIYQRSQARDYIDLYMICKNKGWKMENLIDKARIKFDWHIDPIQLGTQFVKAENAIDLPRMVQNIPEQEWRGFFITEAKRLKDEIFE